MQDSNFNSIPFKWNVSFECLILFDAFYCVKIFDFSNIIMMWELETCPDIEQKMDFYVIQYLLKTKIFKLLYY